MTRGARLAGHVETLWPRAWILPGLPFLVWPAYVLLRGEYRWELGLVVVFGAILPYVGPRSKRLYLGILPVLLVGVLYDAMRFVKNVGLSPSRVHTCDLRALDSALFGWSEGGAPRTVHDAVQGHANLALDVFFAVPYGTFLGAAVFFALYLYGRDYPAMQRFMWAFLLANVAGFVTYHLYPAAPPWYVHQHGCAVDLATHASEGPNLARVDAWLGVPYFRGFYGRSNDVFGAVPSLHVTYPLLIALEGWTAFRSSSRVLTAALRAAALAFLAWMAAAAVYLDHHWVIDVVVGLFYGAMAWVAVRLVAARVSLPLAPPVPSSVVVQAGAE